MCRVACGKVTLVSPINTFEPSHPKEEGRVHSHHKSRHPGFVSCSALSPSVYTYSPWPTARAHMGNTPPSFVSAYGTPLGGASLRIALWSFSACNNLVGAVRTTAFYGFRSIRAIPHSFRITSTFSTYIWGKLVRLSPLTPLSLVVVSAVALAMLSIH